MENQKKYIEIIVDPVAETTSVTLRNVTGKELVDGYVHAAAAVANAIVKNSGDISMPEIIQEIVLRILQEYCQ
ncbi:hypothetical protein [Ruminococcus callidus]|uniref:hypothetical protein n=1 Tax=Ruminococcus callidus TaxID=40519 RepID=UPI00351FA4FC